MTDQKRSVGRPAKEPTKVLAYRVPLRIEKEVDTKTRKLIDKLKKEKK
jgi:hypothetical protein